MHTQTSKRTLFALTTLAGMFVAAPGVVHADPPVTETQAATMKQEALLDPDVITGHHDNKTTGTGDGYDITSGSLIVANPFSKITPHGRLNDTTFNSNTESGLDVSKGAQVTIQGGQFSHNKVDGLTAEGSTVTINGGQFIGNTFDGMEALRGSTLRVTGGTVSGSEYGLVSDPSSTIRITGGTFAGNTHTDLWADGSTITLIGAFREHPVVTTLTGSGSVDVLFVGSTQWQTLKYYANDGGKIKLEPVTAGDIPINPPHIVPPPISVKH